MDRETGLSLPFRAPVTLTTPDGAPIQPGPTTRSIHAQQIVRFLYNLLSGELEDDDGDSAINLSHVARSIDQEGKGNDKTVWNSLDMSHSGIRFLSGSLMAYTHITHLYLNHNSLTFIPEGIFGSLPALTVLDLSRNLLVTLPSDIGNLSNLEELRIYSNRISVLPMEMGRLVRLVRLGFEGNPITSPPAGILRQGARGVVTFLRDRMPALGTPHRRTWTTLVENRNGMLGSFRVLCYNILANSYASQELYFHCPTWALSWEYRKVKLLEEIISHDADIFCLQEMEMMQFYEFFVPEFRRLGYEGIFLPKSRARTMSESERERVDGCGTFYNASMFRVAQNVMIEFNQLATELVDLRRDHESLSRLMRKDNVATILLLDILRPEQRGSKDLTQLCLVNTHIQWNPAFADVKLIQVQLLLEQCQKLIDGREIPLIICGDFNSLPDSAVHTLLHDGYVSPDHPDLGAYAYGDYSSKGLSHSFQLASAYGVRGEPAFTNYTCHFMGTLDYIWFSKELVELCAVLDPLEEAVIRAQVALPNAQFSSDHVALVSDFRVR